MWLHPWEYLFFTPFMRSLSLDNPFDANDHYEILASSLLTLLTAVSMLKPLKLMKTPKIIIVYVFLIFEN